MGELKIIEILGGLGNQMFQYSLYLKFKKLGYNAKIDLSNLRNYKLHNGYELEKIFKIKPEIATYDEVRKYSRYKKYTILNKILNKISLSKKTEFIEKSFFTFDKEIFDNNMKIYYKGYWQNERYFSDIKSEIFNCFKFDQPINELNISVLNKIINSNSVSIHIRRGDYLNDNKRNKICDVNYYKDAVKLINSNISNPNFYIFSDDIDWCMKSFQLSNVEYIYWNKDDTSYIDMQLMSKCKHNIIANSSFSWWAAWLNINPEKIVVTPKYWISSVQTSTFSPKEWINI